MFYKNLQEELIAKKDWEFTDQIKKEIWRKGESDEAIRESYKNHKTYDDGRPIKYGWQLEAEPIFESFEKVQREHTFDYLDSYYIRLKFAYDYWKQYEHEWNLKYKNYIK